MRKKRLEKRKRSSEFDLIRRYFAPLSRGEPGAFGLTDDAASIAVGSERLVITADALVEGVHFPRETKAGLIAGKLLGVNLSDLAAMGASPRAYVMTAALPSYVDDDWLQGFSKSLALLQKTHGLSLIGGDTVATPGPLTLTACMLGEAKAGALLLRSGARPKDAIYVSGTIGDAALGLLAIEGKLEGVEGKLQDHLVDRYHTPRPRVGLGLRLPGVAAAAIDVSDGLVADLGHICEASLVSAVIRAGEVPLSKAARAAIRANPRLIEAVLAGGDDYELLFTAPCEAATALRGLSKELGLPLTRIGNVMKMSGKSPEVSVLDENGAEMKLNARGYLHFA